MPLLRMQMIRHHAIQCELVEYTVNADHVVGDDNRQSHLRALVSSCASRPADTSSWPIKPKPSCSCRLISLRVDSIAAAGRLLALITSTSAGINASKLQWTIFSSPVCTLLHTTPSDHAGQKLLAFRSFVFGHSRPLSAHLLMG